MPVLKAAVFSKDGRTFIFPSIAYLVGDDIPEHLCSEDIGDPIGTFWRAQALGVALHAKWEYREWPTTPDEPTVATIPHAVGELLSHTFMHGAATVWILSGPEFDECAAASKLSASA